MTRIHTFLMVAACLAVTGAGAAQAACLAEYKAKRDNPLELHYDVAQIDGPCTKANARKQLQARMAARGMTLLKVLSVRDE